MPENYDTRELVEQAVTEIPEHIEVSDPPNYTVDYACQVTAINPDPEADEPTPNSAETIQTHLAELGFNTELTEDGSSVLVYKRNHSPALPDSVLA